MAISSVIKNLLMATVGAAIISLEIGGSAQANTLTFDDIPVSFSDTIYNGYGGLNWDNFGVLNTTSLQNTGYAKGTVSKLNVAFNRYGDPATVSIGSGTFNFNSAYLTGAFNSGSILVEGFLGGALKYSNKITVNNTVSTLFNFDFLGIDQLKFLGVDGNDTSGQLSNEAYQFAVDNFTYQGVGLKPVGGEEDKGTTIGGEQENQGEINSPCNLVTLSPCQPQPTTEDHTSYDATKTLPAPQSVPEPSNGTIEALVVLGLGSLLLKKRSISRL